MQSEYRSYRIHITGTAPAWDIIARPLTEALPILFGAFRYTAATHALALEEAQGQIDRLLETYCGRC